MERQSYVYKEALIMAVELKKIDTEKRNERSMHIDSMSTLDMVKLINE